MKQDAERGQGIQIKKPSTVNAKSPVTAFTAKGQDTSRMPLHGGQEHAPYAIIA